jgi:hypothetical protein
MPNLGLIPVRRNRTAIRLFRSIAAGAIAFGVPWMVAGGFFPCLVQAEPRNAAAWRALGIEDLRLHRFSAAISAFQHSLVLQPDSPRNLYSLGVAYAGKHDADRAFEWLERARASHRYDMTAITEEKDLAALRTDKRFAKLLPSPEDFEHPFVEAVKIIREWRGEAAGDQFGWIARKIGDVDGDGITDIVVSAPTHGANGSNAGRVYVYSVGSGRLLWTADGAPGDQLGTGVEGVGDSNGDGVPDVAASGPAGSGVAHLYSGRDGRVLHTFRSNRRDELFGNHISGAGDVDGDGRDDLIVGAWQYSGAAESAGRAYLYSGSDGRLLKTFTCRTPGDAFGFDAVGLGDVDGDGIADLLITSGWSAVSGHHSGRVFVISSGVPKAKPP